jgi:hypothetical protein
LLLGLGIGIGRVLPHVLPLSIEVDWNRHPTVKVAASPPGVRLVTTWTIPAVNILLGLTVRPTRVVTPGCQIGYMDHTGCHQLVFCCGQLVF